MSSRPLAELADVTMGQSPDSNLVGEGVQGLPFLQGSAEFGRTSPTSVLRCARPPRVAKAGSILISVRAPVGEMNDADQDYCIGRGLGAFAAKPGIANTVFLKHAVEQNLPWLHRRSQGSTFSAISTDDLRSMPIPGLPPKRQDEIAAVFGAIDAAIERTQALIDKHQRLKAGLIHDLFKCGVLPSGQLRPPPEVEPGLYRQRRGKPVPATWRETELQNIAQVSRGKFTHRPRNDPKFLDGPFPFIQTGDIAAAAGGYLSRYSQTLSDKGAAVSSRFPAGTIAVTIAANIADTAILSIPMFFPDSVVGVIVGAEADIRFVELSIRLSKPRLEAMAPQSAQKNINLKDLRPLKLMLPPLEEQQAISSRYEAANRPIAVLQETFAKLRAQKLGLMQDLLTGKGAVKVPEPAFTA